MIRNVEPLISGYAQASEYDRVKPADEQVESIRRAAEELDGVWIGCRVERDLWTSKVPYHSRAEFKKLLIELERGDWLIVWRLDRIDGNPFSLVQALRLLANCGVRLCVLDFEGEELRLEGTAFTALVNLMITIADMFRAERREATKRALRHRKERGLAYARFPPLGKKRVVRNGIKLDVWDDRECAQIREIWQRYREGESMAQIARDFYKRRLKTASGKPWVKPYGRKGRLNGNRLYRAYHWYCELLRRGQDLGPIPINAVLGGSKRDSG